MADSFHFSVNIISRGKGKSAVDQLRKSIVILKKC